MRYRLDVDGHKVEKEKILKLRLMFLEFRYIISYLFYCQPM
jgi:hypothetical protein